MAPSRKLTMALSYLNSCIKDFEDLGISYPIYAELCYAASNIANFRVRAIKHDLKHVGIKRKCYNK